MTPIRTKADLARHIKSCKATQKDEGRVSEWGYYPIEVKGKKVTLVLRPYDLTTEYRTENNTRVSKDSLFS